MSPSTDAGGRVRGWLMRVTADRPMKTIIVNDQPYLERYYMGEMLGRQFWLHRFLRADSERHLHSHPWRAVSIVLSGAYVEQLPITAKRKRNDLFAEHHLFRTRTPGSIQTIHVEHIHRIVAAIPETWTLMIVGRERRPTWYFIDDDGLRREEKTSAPDWWGAAGKRAA